MTIREPHRMPHKLNAGGVNAKKSIQRRNKNNEYNSRVQRKSTMRVNQVLSLSKQESLYRKK